VSEKKVFIRTFGCQMNEYDSAKMADVLGASHAMTLTDSPQDADLILFNTCSVREKAQEKVFSDLGRIRHLKRRRPDLLIGVGGCVASQEGARIIERAPFVDLVFGPQTLHRLPAMIEQRRTSGRPQVDISFPEVEKFDSLPLPRVEGVTAFVSIMEGCSKYCTFCVVPYTRGEEVSRPLEDVLTEVADLADQGVREVTLLGQNVNAYHGLDARGQAIGLAALIRAAASVPGIRRVRYMTSHPNDMSEDLIQAHRDVPALAPYLHLPVQSGSDNVLKSMNRRHHVADYLDVVARARAARPDIAFSSDFIIGYPGETDADFDQTLALIRTVGFASSYAFKYSARPGTPAAEMSGQVDEATKARRLAALQELIEAQRQTFNRASVGQRLEVLFEKPGRREGQVIGRSPYMQSVFAEGPQSLIGALTEVEIVAVEPHSLRGRIVSPAS
jgi:tRNA-2-methylthio-N6-dimethylallyladenosine synthase